MSSPAAQREAIRPDARGGARASLAAVFLTGVVTSFPGATLPLWDFHLSSSYEEVGAMFLAFSAAFLLAARLSPGLARRFGVKVAGITGAALAFCSFVALIVDPPPASAPLRWGVLFTLGLALGLIHGGFARLLAVWPDIPFRSIVQIGGIVFGTGCVASAVIVAISLSSTARWISPAIFAALAATVIVYLARWRWPAEAGVERHTDPEIETPPTLRSASEVLMAVTLFVQFGNEWIIGGWLPLMVIQRLGMSPQSALWLLAAYWLAILAGRGGAYQLLAPLRRSRVLLSCAFAAGFGCLILAITTSRFGAVVAVLLIGASFSVVLPLMSDMAGRPRSPRQFFRGVFPWVLAAGLLAPASVGFLTGIFGIGFVTVIPFLGTALVFVLLVAIRLESKWRTSEQV